MIATLLLEFGILYLLYRYLTRRYQPVLQFLFEYGAIVWIVQATLTATYLAWKYLP